MASVGHYVMCNEAYDKVHATLKTMATKGWRTYRPGGANRQDPHAWRIDRINLFNQTSRQIMRGGRIGLAGLAVARVVSRRNRGRRLGPSRGASSIYVEDVRGGGRGVYVDFHLVARRFTSERWRAPAFDSSVRQLRAFLAAQEKAHPGTPIIVGGDANSNKRLALSAQYRQLKTLPDYGRNRYTHLYLYDPTGKVKITGIREQRNASDHDAVVCEVDFG